MMYINANIGVMEDLAVQADEEQFAPLPTHEVFLTDALYMEGIYNPSVKDIKDMRTLVTQGLTYGQAARLVRSIKDPIAQAEAIRVRSLVFA